MITDTRNVGDEFKGFDHEEIMKRLDDRGVELEIAIENLERDYNMGTIVRSANAFGVRRVHVIGRRQWNKRGAMMTDKYLKVVYHHSGDEFYNQMTDDRREIIAIENNVKAISLLKSDLPKRCVLIFGSEANGITDELLALCDATISIPQLGSTRSLNVGVAAGIAMWEWTRQYAK